MNYASDGFRILEEEELHRLCSENKGADQLRGSDGKAYLRLCSRICKKQVFSRGSIIDKFIDEFIIQCGSLNAHKLGKNRVIRVIL